MDYSKMINIRRETNANDNAFAMPVRRQTDDTDDRGGASTYYGSDMDVESYEDYDYNDKHEEMNKGKLPEKLLSYFCNEIRDISISTLEPYHTHTFAVKVSEDFKESIREIGVIEPLLVAFSENYGKYEVISGHRRLEAAKAVGIDKLPCRIAREDTPREILDEIMVITNLQRRNTFTKMELARSLRLLNESRKKQGYRTDKLHNMQFSATKVELSEEFGISVTKMYMLMSLTQLTDFFAKKVDNNEITEKTAYCLSVLSEYEQQIVREYIDKNADFRLTPDKAQMLKEKKEKDKNLDRRIIYAVLSTEYTKKKCSNGMTVKLGSDTVEKYDLKRKSQRELKTIIEKALQNYYENVQEVE